MANSPPNPGATQSPVASFFESLKQPRIKRALFGLGGVGTGLIIASAATFTPVATLVLMAGSGLYAGVRQEKMKGDAKRIGLALWSRKGTLTKWTAGVLGTWFLVAAPIATKISEQNIYKQKVTEPIINDGIRILAAPYPMVKRVLHSSAEKVENILGTHAAPKSGPAEDNVTPKLGPTKTSGHEPSGKKLHATLAEPTRAVEAITTNKLEAKNLG